MQFRHVVMKSLFNVLLQLDLLLALCTFINNSNINVLDLNLDKSNKRWLSVIVCRWQLITQPHYSNSLMCFAV